MVVQPILNDEQHLWNCWIKDRDPSAGNILVSKYKSLVNYHVRVNPLLILDENALYAQPSYRGAYSQLLQTAIDVGIAEAAFAACCSVIVSF